MWVSRFGGQVLLGMALVALYRLQVEDTQDTKNRTFIPWRNIAIQKSANSAMVTIACRKNATLRHHSKTQDSENAGAPTGSSNINPHFLQNHQNLAIFCEWRVQPQQLAASPYQLTARPL